MKILILGMGNPILTDDRVGLEIARAVDCQISRPDVSVPDVSVVESDLAGLNLLDILAGFDHAIIVDAIQTRGGKPGSIFQFNLGDLQVTRHCVSSHGIDLFTALDLGKRLGLELPDNIEFFVVEVADVSTFGEECTTEVKKAIPACTGLILGRIEDIYSNICKEPLK